MPQQCGCFQGHDESSIDRQSKQAVPICFAGAGTPACSQQHIEYCRRSQQEQRRDIGSHIRTMPRQYEQYLYQRHKKHIYGPQRYSGIRRQPSPDGNRYKGGQQACYHKSHVDKKQHNVHQTKKYFCFFIIYYIIQQTKKYGVTNNEQADFEY